MAVDPPPVEERLRELVLRELGAEQVNVCAAEACSFDADDPCWLSAELPDDRVVAARFPEPPADRSALARRMQILVSAFSYLLARQSESRGPRAPVAHSLKGELAALATRARAVDAIVIDAHSPVIWGSARGFRQVGEPTEELAEAIRLLDLSRHELLSLVTAELASDPPPPPDQRDMEELRTHPPPDSSSFSLAVRATAMLRALPEFSQLKRGHPLTHRYRDEGFGVAAHSFAGIYLLVLVFDGVFDEIRAERAVQESILRIERLVLALPPRDPSPTSNANVIRFSRRRR